MMMVPAARKEARTGPFTAQCGLSLVSSLPVPSTNQTFLPPVLHKAPKETSLGDFCLFFKGSPFPTRSPQPAAQGPGAALTGHQFETTLSRAAGNAPILSRGLIKLLH